MRKVRKQRKNHVRSNQIENSSVLLGDKQTEKPYTWIDGDYYNSTQGYKSEVTVSKKFKAAGYEVKHNSKNQQVKTENGSIPDLVIKKNGQTRFVQVKSIDYKVKDGKYQRYGRVQFKKQALKELADKDGIVVIEVRNEDKPSEYYQDSAENIYELVKHEQGERVLLDYAQIERLPRFNARRLN